MNPSNLNYNQMYNPNYNYNYSPNFQGNSNQNDRLIGGGFAFPFLLGGVTGAAIAPAFFGGYNRPYYNNYYYPYPYYPRPYYYR